LQTSGLGTQSGPVVLLPPVLSSTGSVVPVLSSMGPVEPVVLVVLVVSEVVSPTVVVESVVFVVELVAVAVVVGSVVGAVVMPSVPVPEFEVALALEVVDGPSVVDAAAVDELPPSVCPADSLPPPPPPHATNSTARPSARPLLTTSFDVIPPS
jgi:hypothetical protein